MLKWTNMIIICFAFFVLSCDKKSDGEDEKDSKHGKQDLTTKDCSPEKTLTSVACKDEIPNSKKAFKFKICNKDGDGSIMTKCVLDSCDTGYGKVKNLCLAQKCIPGVSLDPVDCKDEAKNSASALKSMKCDNEGRDYVFGNCVVSACQQGYKLNGNICVPLACSPNTSADPVDCIDEMPFSSAAKRTKSCNESGNEFIYGECLVETCAPGYLLENNSCIPQLCSPTVSEKSPPCQDEIPFSSLAHKTKTCNSRGDGFDYGQCIATECQELYRLSNDGSVCIPNVCSPGSTLSNICHLSGAYDAYSTDICNDSGTGYISGQCKAVRCGDGTKIDCPNSGDSSCWADHYQGSNSILNEYWALQSDECTYRCVPGNTISKSSNKNCTPGAAQAHTLEICDPTGTHGIYGGCVATMCNVNYELIEGKCEPITCSPNSYLGQQSCHALNSVEAVRIKNCNETGNGYVFGECSAIACSAGYSLIRRGGRPNSCQPTDIGSCAQNSQCQINNIFSKFYSCIKGRCKILSELGGFCDDNDDCKPEIWQQNACIRGRCAELSGLNDPCDENSDCRYPYLCRRNNVCM